MYQVSQLRKIRSHLNKFVTQTKRDMTKLKVESDGTKIVHTLSFGLLGIRATVYGNGDKISPVTVAFLDWYKGFDNIAKGDKEIEIGSINNQLFFNQERYISEEAKSGSATFANFATVDPTVVNNGFFINNVCAGNGKLSVNNKIYFCFENELLKIINTNDIMLHSSNILNVICQENCTFAISNEYSSKMKTWFSCMNNAMKMNIAKTNTFVQFSCELDDVLYEMFVKMESDSSIEKTYHILDSLLNKKWRGVPVTLDMNEILQSTVEEAVAVLITSGKKVKKRELKKQLDAFTASTNKVKMLKTLDKNIDISYLNISKSVEKENIYILRTLYQNYLTATNECKPTVYFLSTESEALMFGYQDDVFKFKTLFMLRKPKEAIAEISDEELENIVNSEEEVIEVSEEEVFEPT